MEIETKIIIVLAALAMCLAVILLETYVKLLAERRCRKRLEMMSDFLLSITKRNSSGPSLNALAKMDIDILESINYQLGEYYKKNFFGLTTKISVREVDEYVKSINELPESSQKTYIKAILKDELIYQPRIYAVADFIFQTIKVSNSTNRDCCLIEFLFGDVKYLQEKSERIILILNKCKDLFVDIHVEEQLKENMIDDFDELLKLVK